MLLVGRCRGVVLVVWVGGVGFSGMLVVLVLWVLGGWGVLSSGEWRDGERGGRWWGVGAFVVRVYSYRVMEEG